MYLNFILISLLIFSIFIKPLKTFLIHIYPISSSFLPIRVIGNSNVKMRLFYDLQIKSIKYGWDINNELILYIKYKNPNKKEFLFPLIILNIYGGDPAPFIYVYNPDLLISSTHNIYELILRPGIIRNDFTKNNLNIFIKFLPFF